MDVGNTEGERLSTLVDGVASGDQSFYPTSSGWVSGQQQSFTHIISRLRTHRGLTAPTACFQLLLSCVQCPKLMPTKDCCFPDTHPYTNKLKRCCEFSNSSIRDDLDLGVDFC